MDYLHSSLIRYFKGLEIISRNRHIIHPYRKHAEGKIFLVENILNRDSFKPRHGEA